MADKVIEALIKRTSHAEAETRIERSNARRWEDASNANRDEAMLQSAANRADKLVEFYSNLDAAQDQARAALALVAEEQDKEETK